MNIIFGSLVVFTLTLLVTKSKLFACKRDFVVKRFEESVNPTFIHYVWHAIWTCPMCSGFWFAFIVCLFFPCCGWIFDVLIISGINWIIHCLESLLFETAYFFKKINESDSEQV